MCDELMELTDKKFQSTPSARRATKLLELPANRVLFQSTPSARRATVLTQIFANIYSISIHALREESDLQIPIFCIIGYKFQSTPSARRATPEAPTALYPERDFNPRPPRGGRPVSPPVTIQTL